ncbi:MAG: DnaA regulatory inactivator Hda [Gammaproteobacteria bacterium]|nr:DnaA regulatory inactivator Hda [Gammaproteobacteria bacterium]
MTSSQMVLDLKLRDSYSFSNFIAGENELVLELLQAMALAEGEQQLYIWGNDFCGKSHLLQAVCQAAAGNQYLSAYLPFKQLVHCASDVLEGLENVDIVCIDDIQLIQHKADWHEPIFDLINRLRAAGKFLLFASILPPNEMIIELEDLRSRLNWGPVIKIRSLNDDQKQQALQLRAKSRGFELPDNVANYILNNFERDMSGLLEKLEQLDKVSLEQQRRLTVPFVKQVFG